MGTIEAELNTFCIIIQSLSLPPSPFLPYSLLPADQDEELSASFSVPCMFVYCNVPYQDGNKLIDKRFRKPTTKWFLL